MQHMIDMLHIYYIDKYYIWENFSQLKCRELCAHPTKREH